MALARVVHIGNLDIGLLIHIRNQMRYLRDRGYEIHAVCPPGQFISRDGTTPDGIPVKVIGYSWAALTPLQDLRAFVRLVRYLRQERFDIVHTHGIKPGLLGRLAARIARVPIVLHTIHGLFFFEGMGALEARFWAEIERLGMRLGDYALSQNQEDVDTVVRMGICRPDRIGYLGNGIDLSCFDPAAVDQREVQALRQVMGVAAGEKVVAIGGRLLVEKGYLEFFEAAKRIRQRRSDVHFWAIGPAQPGKTGALLRDHPVVAEAAEFVRFLGMRSDVPRVLAASDVFALPSHGREGIPRVLMEAAAMRRPIVSTNVRGCRDVVKHEVTGLLVPSRNSGELAAAIVRLVDDPARAVQLGVQAGELARRQFDENECFRRVADCYESLLRRRLPTLATGVEAVHADRVAN